MNNAQQCSIEETKRRIEVMQAWVDGKKIEYRSWGTNGWVPVPPDPIWAWSTADYRIAPEPSTPVPRVIWVNEYPGDGPVAAHWSKEDAVRAAAPKATGIAVRYVRQPEGHFFTEWSKPELKAYARAAVEADRKGIVVTDEDVDHAVMLMHGDLSQFPTAERLVRNLTRAALESYARKLRGEKK